MILAGIILIAAVVGIGVILFLANKELKKS
jgi:hypothetical protein